MSATRARTPLPGRILRWGAPVAAVALALMIFGGPSATAATPLPAYPSTTAPAWNNTAVECVFGSSAPSMTATAVGAASVGMAVAVGTVTESSLILGLAASATLSGATWTEADLSTESEYALAYSTTVPVRTILGIELGTTTVTVGYALPEAPAGTVGKTVTVTMTIAGWPWQLLYPHLSANLSLAPADPRAEHLAENSTAGMEVMSVANTTSAIDAYFTAPTAANATFRGGLFDLISVTAAMLGTTAAGGTLSLSFGAGASNASSVGFTAPMVVVPPAPVITLPGHVRVPVDELVAAVGAAVVISLALAGTTRRVRRTPSDLEYIPEEEQP